MHAQENWTKSIIHLIDEKFDTPLPSTILQKFTQRQQRTLTNHLHLTTQESNENTHFKKENFFKPSMKFIGTREIEIQSKSDGSASRRTSKGMIALFHSGLQGSIYEGGDEHDEPELYDHAHSSLMAVQSTGNLYLKVLETAVNNGQENTLIYEGNSDATELKLTPEQMQSDIDRFNLQNSTSGGQPQPLCQKWLVNSLLTSRKSGPDQASSVEAVYRKRDVDNTILINIKVSSGNIPIVRNVFSLNLHRSTQPCGTLKLFTQISSSLQNAQSQIAFLETNRQSLERNLHSWKETASRLHRDHWVQEKEELMGNCLVLLNRVKSDLRQSRQKINEEKQRYNILEAKIKELRTEYEKRRMVVDHEDDHDVEIFSEQDVDQLAMGVRIQGGDGNDKHSWSKASSATVSADMVVDVDADGITSGKRMLDYTESRKRKAKHSKSDEVRTKKRTTKDKENGKKLLRHSSAQSSQSRSSQLEKSQNGSEYINSQMSYGSRRNPHTGAIEMWDPQDMFSDYSSEDNGK